MATPNYAIAAQTRTTEPAIDTGRASRIARVFDIVTAAGILLCIFVASFWTTEEDCQRPDGWSD
jgi:hypothetical protein